MRDASEVIRFLAPTTIGLGARLARANIGAPSRARAGARQAARAAKRFLPLGAFGALAALLYLGFTLRDPHLLPSALVNKPFPEFDLPLLDGGRANRDRLVGEPRLVNVWATWCPTCLTEHALLLRIRAEAGVSIVGVNYKDDAALARSWLERYGNPYDFNILDGVGDLGVELGVYGAPETFLVDAEGLVRYKHVGAVTDAVWRNELRPALAAVASG